LEVRPKYGAVTAQGCLGEHLAGTPGELELPRPRPGGRALARVCMQKMPLSRHELTTIMDGWEQWGRCGVGSG
jgi:hypothetical protein